MVSDSPILIATAGHVDHGKSTLVTTLTGTDPDRWVAEKQRGITIDLGYAHAEADGRTYSFVDVPGHERFIHNMLAGVGSIDAVLFVIAADESIMPQTREHARALSWLGINQVCVVLTKIDLVDEELLELLDEEVGEWLEAFGWQDAPRIHFSSKRPETTRGVFETLKNLEKKQALSTASFRMSIDRVFTSQGAGTVITGTVERGKLQREDQVHLIPQDRQARIRQIQVHGKSCDAVGSHMRAAINLGDVHYKDLSRGDLVYMGSLPMRSKRILAKLQDFEEDWSPSSKHIFHIHHLAAHLQARLMWRDGAFAMLALESPHPFWALDRGLIRDGSPLRVIAGFQVLDPKPFRSKRKQLLPKLRDLPQIDDLHAWQEWFISGESELIEVEGVASRCGEALDKELMEAMVRIGNKHMMRRDHWEPMEKTFIDRLKACHKEQPLHQRVQLSSFYSRLEDWPKSLIQMMMEHCQKTGSLVLDGDRIKFVKHRVMWRENDLKNLREMLRPLRTEFPIVDFKGRKEEQVASDKILKALVWEKFLIPLTSELFIPYQFMARITKKLHDDFSGQTFSIQELKESFGFSRKYAIPLLEYLDKNGYTRREAEGRTWIARECPQYTSAWEMPREL